MANSPNSPTASSAMPRDSGVAGMPERRFTEPGRPPRRGSALNKLTQIATGSSLRHSKSERFEEDNGSSSDSEAEQAPNSAGPAARPGVNFPLSTTRLNSASRFSIVNKDLNVRGKPSKRDGRLKLSIRHAANRGYMGKAIDAGFRHHMGQHKSQNTTADASSKTETPVHDHGSTQKPGNFPKLNIVIMVIGSRGDIQPFIKIGRILKSEYGHRVRIATHPSFREFVKDDCGLEHFNVGGDPSELMAFMVKNPGLIPGLDSIRHGEIGKRRAAMAEMFEGFWRACVNSSDDDTDDSSAEPFVADAIIANPPSFAHVHCAERLGCPLHIMFTFPYTPTHSFPHPLANIKPGTTDTSYANFLSYPLVEMMTWQGLGDLVNDFREQTLGLDPVSTLWAPGQLYRMHVPYTYLWSPGLVPKPSDWGSEISIAGFCFLDLASDFKPPEDLAKFLDAGEPPVYIGFGSIVLDDPEEFTKMIFEAVQKTGVRAVINKGWGGFGGQGDAPEGVFMLENTPHDWLFPKCKAVIHHGGAGTTAIGLKCAKPTMIVPFFGDQAFWGSMVSEAKAGAHECINHKQLTVENFVKGIKECLSDEAQENVQKIADSIEKEGDGAENAVRSFHNSLTFSGERSMQCSVIKDRVAVWQLKGSKLRLSALAAELLVQQGRTTYRDLRLHRQNEWNDFQGFGGPITGGSAAVYDMVTGFTRSVGEGPLILGKDIHERAMHEHRRLRHIHRRRTKKKLAEDRKSSEADAKSHAERGKQSASTAANGTNGEGDSCVPSSTAAQTQTKPERPQLMQRNESAFPAGSTQNIGAIAHQLRREQSNNDNTVSSSAASTLSSEFENGVVVTLAKDTAMGVGKPVLKIVKFPMDLLVGVADGFHNLPRLYGDPTVRRPIRISGYKSGFKAAGREFFLGFYDAATGVVVLPYKDVKERGPLGIVTGVGKGVGGVVCKSCAAVIGPFGYSLKGIHRELVKSKTPIAEVQRKRMAQGRFDLSSLNEKERQAALDAAKEGWKTMAEIWDAGSKVKSGEWNPEDNTVRDAQGRWVGGRLVASVVGRVRHEKEMRNMERHGAFASVQDTARAVDARRRGKSLDQACKPAGEGQA